MNLRGLTLSALCLLTAACGSDSVTGPDTFGTPDDRAATTAAYAQARARWDSVRPASYDYRLRVLCFCAPSVTSPVTVTVRGTQVVGVVRDGGGAVEPELADLYPSVDGMFDQIRDAIAEDADEIRVTYDPATGMPTEVVIDRSYMIADEEVRYEAGGLQTR